MDPSLHLLTPLTHAVSLACTYGPWVIFVALAWRFLAPVRKGGR